MKELLKQLGLTQAAFAESIGISRTLVADWTSGHREITKLHALAIQSVHGVNAEWLLTGQGEMFLAQEPIPGLSEQEMMWIKRFREDPELYILLKGTDDFKKRLDLLKASFKLTDEQAEIFAKMWGGLEVQKG